VWLDCTLKGMLTRPWLMGVPTLCHGCKTEDVEAFEQFVALFLEQQDFVVSSAVKFPFARRTRRTDHKEVQTHGYEVDLVGARGDRLILATVKSFLGSRGVVSDHVTGVSPDTAANKRYALLNDVELRRSVVRQAARRYGYSVSQVQLSLYVGRFSGPVKGENEQVVRDWCKKQRVGAGRIEVKNLDDMVPAVIDAATTAKQYRDNPVLVTMKLLQATGMLRPNVPAITIED
jgi:hypothetical protein